MKFVQKYDFIKISMSKIIFFLSSETEVVKVIEVSSDRWAIYLISFRLWVVTFSLLEHSEFPHNSEYSFDVS